MDLQSLDRDTLHFIAALAGGLALLVQFFWQTTHCSCCGVGKAAAEQRAARRAQEQARARSEDADDGEGW